MLKKCKCNKCEPQKEASRKGIAIVGNMNVGKTTLFSRLCGTDETSMNFPGTTVAVATGAIRGTDLLAIDTPGTSSLFSSNEDDRISRDVLVSSGLDIAVEGAVLVVDAKNLKRSIALALQFAEYGVPMLIDINMTDEAIARGIEIDYEELSEIFGIDVVSTVATEGIGVSDVKTGIACMRVPNRLVTYPAMLEEFLRTAVGLLNSSDVPARLLGLLLFAGDRAACRYVKKHYGPGMLEELTRLAEERRKEIHIDISSFLTNLYNQKADQIVRQVQRVEPPTGSPFLERLGNWSMQLSTGIPIALGVVVLMFLFVGVFGASFLVEAIDTYLFQGLLLPLSAKLVAPIPWALLRDMIIDPDFGLLPTGVFLVVGIVLPVLLCFYIFFGLLEDSGYLSRISVLLNKVLSKIGLNGKGVLPLVMGFSCITMAILTTRMLDTKKEKNIAIFLLLLGIPCSPLLAVMFTILSGLPWTASATVFGLIFFQLLAAGLLAARLLPGRRSPLIMEIPLMRVPRFGQLIRRSLLRTYSFMKEAVPIFIIASVVVFFFDRVGGLTILEDTARPLVNGLMGLPEKSVQVFIKTIIRKESGAAELVHLRGSFDNVQLVVNTFLLSFMIPCLNAAIVVFKERGMKTAIAILGSVAVYAVLAGSVLNHVCRFFGITFT